MASNLLKNNTLIDSGLGILFGVTLSKLLFLLLMIPAILGKTSTDSSPQSDFTIVGGLLIFSILYGLVLLVINKRLALTIGGWFLVGSLFWFLLINRGSTDLLENYQTLRNLTYLFLLPYLGAHFIIHGIFWLINHKRKILTLSGTVNFILIVLLSTFAVFLTTW